MQLLLLLLLILSLFLFSPSFTQSLPVPPRGEIHPSRKWVNIARATRKLENVSCSSWQLATETNNLRRWKSIPATCESYFGHYFLGHRYRDDSALVTKEASKYARRRQLSGGGKDIWIFDIDETSLSNLPFFSKLDFGLKPYSEAQSDKWVAAGAAPALPESLKLYKELLTLGIKVVFLTGRTEEFREITARNLKKVGYHSWEKLILRKGNELEITALEYKSAERLKLVKQGYRIVGNIGDQWSDILGSPEGDRTFKLPNPLYYIS
ncbi:acid phosphatase 1-like [Phalaenopsis equestris]|uniref:acid phosphatase 1-like n=1 Tax=Phalaenopsis equestris TaxID=78828 RepID=UPI0009E5174D|nr:acid phosphatase 1-like [Phalaenopsis equestris]